MDYELYLRNGKVYLPTMGKMGEGFYRGIEPVAVVFVSDIDGVRKALQATIARGNPIVPMLRRSEWQAPVLLKHSGVKSWSAFERGMTFWSIKQRGACFQIAKQKKQSNGMWKDDPEKKIILSSCASVDDVIEEMIAILQAAASQK